MPGTRRHHRIDVPSLLAAMALLAFALHALVPAGFMPSARGDFTELVICSGMGQKTIRVPAGGVPSSGDHADKISGACAYQSLAAAKLLPAPAIAERAAASIIAAPPAHVLALSNSENARAPFDARGPPSV